MQSVSALLQQIDKNLSESSDEQLGNKLCSIAEVMSGGSVGFDAEQMAQFDMILCRFSVNIEAIALSKLGFILAHMANGPPQMINSLARHEDIVVAGPILAGSAMLSEALLCEIIQSRPQSHLRAVCERANLAESVSLALLKHGDGPIRLLLAKNRGARINDQGF